MAKNAAYWEERYRDLAKHVAGGSWERLSHDDLCGLAGVNGLKAAEHGSDLPTVLGLNVRLLFDACCVMVMEQVDKMEGKADGV